jgi:hypothetical protein
MIDARSEARRHIDAKAIVVTVMMAVMPAMMMVVMMTMTASMIVIVLRVSRVGLDVRRNLRSRSCRNRGDDTRNGKRTCRDGTVESRFEHVYFSFLLVVRR